MRGYIVVLQTFGGVYCRSGYFQDNLFVFIILIQVIGGRNLL